MKDGIYWQKRSVTLLMNESLNLTEQVGPLPVSLPIDLYKNLIPDTKIGLAHTAEKGFLVSTFTSW